jgi:glycosyltransferase involved in cell wall biosynthesis
MRVTHVITRLVVGGAQENTVATVLGLRSKPGVEVELISGPETGPEGSLQSCLTVWPELLTIVPRLVRRVAPIDDVLALLQLARLFRKRQPHLVHTHSGKAGILGRIAARRAGVPLIVHHIHGPSFGPFQGQLANAVFLNAERFAASATTHFLCSANAMSNMYLSAGIGRPEMYTRILSGFDIEPFLHTTNDPALRAELGFDESDFVIGKIARLFPLKGHEDLFFAFQEMLARWPQARLLLVGGGELKAQLEKRTRSLGLGNKVVFAGLVPPDQVPRYVGIMDVLVHLSTREGLPRALPQALAACKPVISYDLYGANEVCFNNETGFLVNAGDCASVARHLLQLAADKNLRHTLGHKGQMFVKERFTIERMVEEQYKIYLQLARHAGLAVNAEASHIR